MPTPDDHPSSSTEPAPSPHPHPTPPLYHTDHSAHFGNGDAFPGENTLIIPNGVTAVDP